MVFARSGLAFIIVSSLPTRNWNINRCSRSTRSSPFRAYLQGIETRLQFFNCFCILYVSSLPTRNWNFWNRLLCNLPSYVSSLPTRNWNSIKQNWALYVVPSFEPTYKELKHYRRKWCLFELASFEPTYKELKLFHVFTVAMSKCCFEPTYKELKPVVFGSFFEPIFVFRAYLQGIETRLRKSHIQPGIPFRAYLQGIETNFLGHANEVFLYVSSLPTRNWNAGAGAWRQPVHPGFEPTYKELKHKRSDLGNNKWGGFRAYLQGIETI